MSRKNVVLVALLALIMSALAVVTTTSPAAADITTGVRVDAHVQQLNPNTNFGTSTLLTVNNSTSARRYAYVKIDVPSLPAGETLVSASLRVYVSALQTLGTRLFADQVVNDPWTELNLTYNNQPTLLSTATAFGTANASGTWVTIPLTGVTPGQTVSYRIRSNTATLTTLHSQENVSGNDPEIFLDTNAAPPPVRTPTATRGSTACGVVDVDYATGASDNQPSTFVTTVDGVQVDNESVAAPSGTGGYGPNTLAEDSSGGSADVVVTGNGTTLLSFAVNTDCVQPPVQNPSATRTTTACGDVGVSYATGAGDNTASDFVTKVDGVTVDTETVAAPSGSGGYTDTLAEDSHGGLSDVVVTANGTQVLAFQVDTDCVTAPPLSLKQTVHGTWVLQQVSSAAELESYRTKINAALAVPGVVGLSVRWPWDAADMTGTETTDPLLDKAYDIASSNGKELSVRFMAGAHTPARVFNAGAAYYTKGTTKVPLPWDFNGLSHTVFVNEYAAYAAKVAAWSRAHNVHLMHFSWWGQDWAELNHGAEVRGVNGNPPTGYTYAKWLAGQKELIDVAASLRGPDLAVELPLSGYGPLSGGQSADLADYIVSKVGPNSDQFFVQANGLGPNGEWGAPDQTVEAQFDTIWNKAVSRGTQMIQPQDYDWAAVYDHANAPPQPGDASSTYVEVYLPSFTLTNQAQLKQQIAAFAASSSGTGSAASDEVAASKIVGMSAPANLWDQRLAEVGSCGVEARRIFADLSSTGGSQGNLIQQAIDAGMMPVVSYKVPSAATMASGGYDAWLTTLNNQLAAYAPARITATYWHEPNGDMTGTQFQQGSQRFLDKITASNVSVGPILNGWLLDNQQATFESFTNPTLLAGWDFVAVDSYQSGSPSAPGTKMPARAIPLLATWLDQHGQPNKPIGLGEYNGFTGSAIAAAGDAILSTPEVWFGLAWNSDTATFSPLTGDRLTAYKATKADARALHSPPC